MNTAIIRLLPVLALAGCTGSSTPQTTAQAIDSNWPIFTGLVGVAVSNSGVSAAQQTKIAADETALGTQVAACATGTDPNCTAEIQASILSFVKGLNLGTKGQADLALAVAVLNKFVPGITGAPSPTSMNAPGFTYASGHQALLGRVAAR